MTEAQECPQLSQSPQQPPCSPLPLRRSEAFSGAYWAQSAYMQHLIPSSQSFPPLTAGAGETRPEVSAGAAPVLISPSFLYQDGRFSHQVLLPAFVIRCARALEA